MDIRVNYLLEVKLRIREGGNIVVHLVFTRISTRRALLVLLAMATVLDGKPTAWVGSYNMNIQYVHKNNHTCLTRTLIYNCAPQLAVIIS